MNEKLLEGRLVGRLRNPFYHLHAAVSQVSTCGIYHWPTKPTHVLALRGPPMSISVNLRYRCQASLEGKSGPVESGLTGQVAMGPKYIVSEPDPQKTEKEGLAHPLGWKCTLPQCARYEGALPIGF